MANCPNLEKNKAECTCTYSCDKRGLCCECVRYHRAAGQIPGCFFTAAGEATYDRSVRKLCQDRCAGPGR